MESTLQGLFVEYSATFEHISGLGDERLSLIKSVEIHELIRVTNAEQVDGNDGLPDFLVNDLGDPQDLPDTLYLSDGSVVAVGLGFNAMVDAAPVLSDLRIEVTADMTNGWSYLKMDDPSLGDLTLIGIERSDGTTLPLENFWQTDRTFIGGGQRPVLEDKIHLLDYESTGIYTFVFSNGDLTGPQVVDFAGVVPNPTTETIDVVDVTFTEVLADGTFDETDLVLTRNGADVALSGLSIAFVSGTTYRISGSENLVAGDVRVTFEDRGFNTYRVHGINWVQAFVADPQIADFTFTIDATGITDAAGNVGSGLMSSTWTIDLDLPLAATDLAIATFSGPVVEGLVNSTNATVTGTLAEAGLMVAIRDMTTNTELVRETIAGTTFSLPIEFPSFGQHRLRVRTVDAAGNTTDAFIEHLFVTDTPPVVESITGVPNEFSRGAIDAVDVTFVSPVDPTTVTKLALTVTHNGGANLVNGTVSVEALADGLTYRFNGLSPITGDEGLYNLDFDFGNVANPSGLRSNEASGFSWRNDRTGPTSSIDRLQFVQELGTFVINLNGADSDLAFDVPGSGIIAYDLYVSDYRSPFQLMESIPADVATTTFIGEPNQLYVFRTVARDAAGNIESKPNGIDAWTYLPDIFAPVIQVDAVDTADATFEIDFSGTDRGKALRAFDLYAQVDSGEIEKIATIAAGTSDGDGVYSGSYEYQAISDGTEHDYRFFTVGVDRRGNTELEPELNFFRLLGDADGDGDADNSDLAAVAGAFGQMGSNLDGDLNGDGRVNAFDRLLWFRGRGKNIAASLPRND